MLLRFGKHKGKDTSEVPKQYLHWLSKQDWIKDDLKQHLTKILKGYSPHDMKKDRKW